MNNKTIVLCFILVLLVVVTLNRWEKVSTEQDWWGVALFQRDRLSGSVVFTIRYRHPAIAEHEGRPQYWKNYQRPYVTHGITAFLYLFMGATVIALLKETKIDLFKVLKKERQEKEE